MTTRQAASGGARTYTNIMLTLIVVLLGAITLGRGPSDLVADAHAQPGAASALPPEEATGLTNAAEQRKIMIAELRGISARLDRLDAAMSRVLNVKVVEMPPVRVQESGEKP
ncbi:MAG: hypothetical protein SFY69_12785 [Planctomycetota bacterium]|nr:hypothetical protein [Planctomycetota bacterium]